MTEPTRSLSLSGKYKTATQLLQCPVIKLTTISFRSGGKKRDVHSSLLIDTYALFSDVSLRRQASNDPGREIPDPFAQER